MSDTAETFWHNYAQKVQTLHKLSDTTMHKLGTNITQTFWHNYAQKLNKLSDTTINKKKLQTLHNH